VKDKII